MALYEDSDLSKVLREHDQMVSRYKEENGIQEPENVDFTLLEFVKDPKPTTTLKDIGPVYRSPEFTRVMNEYFDVTDDKTRLTLLAIDEADQNKVMVSLTSKLYDSIMDKVDDIDFGEIPDTKGDITKLSNYTKLIDCLNIMEKLLIEYKQDTGPVKTVQVAIGNIVSRKDTFEKAFRYKIELPMVAYNTIVLSIITATTYMISTMVNFIKLPGDDNFKITLDKNGMVKTKQHLIYTNLEKFNESCRSGEFDRCMEYVIRNNMKNLTGMSFGVVAGGVAIVALIFAIIPIIRELIFLAYYSRVRTSEYFEAQAALLQMNAANIEANENINKEEKEKIIKKQSNIAEFFKKISNTLAIKGKTAEAQATKEIVATNKKYTTDEVMDGESLDSANSVLF